MASWIGSLALVIMVTLLLYGSFSRLTHGRYTPTFYDYQLDRAPDNASTRLIPFGDLVFAAGLMYPPTRAVAASLCALFMFGGVLHRTVGEGKNAASDLAMMLTVLIISLDTVLGVE
ncbi:hypothetical protein N0V82_000399 [Gnomoniopsis sp. IMI 355080]|nr:hypothetical protein N0V82_000399 [Gnomoniopsis sp. IMI 355080]